MRQRTTLRSPSACALALLCCLTANGCDARQLVAPQARTIPPPSQDASDGGALIGAASVAANQTAGVPLGPVRPSTYVLVQVGGQYDGKPNPACVEQPPSWPCIFNAPASDFYDLAPYTTGPVQAWVVEGGSLSSVPLRGSGGALNTPGNAIGLYYGEAAGELRVRASVNNFVSQNPNPEGGITSWIISGAYSVTAVEINPLTFTGGPTGDAVGTVTYSVAATAPLKFINPDGVSPAAPPGDPSWYFVPGESVPLEHGPGAAFPIDACFRQMICTYTPPPDMNGRMQVVAYVENRIVIGRSAEVRNTCQSAARGPLGSPSVRLSVSGSECQQEPKLVLTCDSTSLHRGSRIACAAATEPAGATVTNLKWEFHDVQGHTVTGPAGEDKWGGIMVVGGEMKVFGDVDGKPQAATLGVTVTPRDWTGKITFPPEPEPEWVRGDPLLYPPLVEGDTLADGTLGKMTYPNPEPASGWREGSGPNKGWFFLPEPPYFSPHASHIWLNEALRPDDPFYQAQRGRSPGLGHTVLGRVWCGQDFMRSLERQVPRHESGHYSRAENFAKSREGADMLESAIRWGDPETAAQVQEAFAAFIQASDAIQDKWDRDDEYRVPCDFTPINK